MLSLKLFRDSFITTLIFLLSTLLGLDVVSNSEEENFGNNSSAEQLFEKENPIQRVRPDEV